MRITVRAQSDGRKNIVHGERVMECLSCVLPWSFIKAANATSSTDHSPPVDTKYDHEEGKHDLARALCNQESVYTPPNAPDVVGDRHRLLQLACTDSPIHYGLRQVDFVQMQSRSSDFPTGD